MLNHSEPNRYPSRANSTSLVAGVVLLVGLIVLSPKLVSMYVSSPGEPASASGTTLVEPDPAEMQAMLDRTASGAGFGNKISSQAQDAHNKVIAGADRSFAKRWVTSASSPTGQELNIIVISEPFMSLTDAQKDCDARLAAGHALTCVASADGDLVVQDIERGAERFTDGWPVATKDRWAKLGADLWLLHQSIVRSPNGTTVYAHEATRASGPAEARQSWKLTQEWLRDAATKLAVPL